MANRKITDLDSIGTLATGDLFVVTDESQGDIAKNASIDILTNYVVSLVPSSARAFGGGANQIATWAEGDSVEIIPASKLPPSLNPDLSNYVTLDGAQTITGIKALASGTTIGGQEVVTTGNAQDITGKKTITAPDLTGITDVDTIRFDDGTTFDTALLETTFGSGSGEVADWAEGDDTTLIPISKIPLAGGGGLNTVQTTVNTITMGGTRGNVFQTNSTNEFSTITMFDGFDSTSVVSPLNVVTSAASGTSESVIIQVDYPTIPNPGTTRVLSITLADTSIQYGSIGALGGSPGGNAFVVEGIAVGVQGDIAIGEAVTTQTSSNVISRDQPTVGNTGTIVFTGDISATLTVGSIIAAGTSGTRLARVESVSVSTDTTATITAISNQFTATIGGTVTYASASSLVTLTTGSTTFSYDPDTANTVYTTSIVNEEFTTSGVNITNHLTQIGNSIAGLETDITWDGVITSIPASLTVVDTDGQNNYSTPVGPGEDFWRFATTLGDNWADGTNWDQIIAGGSANIRFEIAMTGAAEAFNTIFVGDTVRITLPSGDWVELVAISKAGRTTPGDEVFEIRYDAIADSFGTINGLSVDGTVLLDLRVVTPARSSITLDLGTPTNIASSFTVTGGTNGGNTLVNTDGTSTTSGTASTITIDDYNNSEITSFTVGTADPNENQLPGILSQIESVIDSNVETPTDCIASIEGSNIIIRSQQTGATFDGLWSITIDNNGITGADAGNLTASTAISSLIDSTALDCSNVVFINVPFADPGDSGKLYQDNGFIKISQG